MNSHQKEILANAGKRAIEFACELVRIPSDVTTRRKEADVALFLKKTLKSFGCEVWLQEVEAGRSNVIGIMRGSGNGRSLMLNGHMDTVPPGAMQQPFTPEIQDGKLYGRGAADMKGGIAGMVAAMESIVREGIELAGDLVFVGTVAEETGSLGMNRFVQEAKFRADFCVVGEPTSLQLGLAHKGIEWVRITTKGKAAHASIPTAGISAISHMARIIRALEEELLPKLQARHHPLLGSPTITVGTIRGGERPNIVPDTCTIEIDRRWLPEESVDLVLEEFQEILDSLAEEIPGFQATISRMEEISAIWHGPFETSETSDIVAIARHATRKCAGKGPKVIGLPYWTDGALAHHAGIPTIILGPGDPDKCHSEDEYVSVAQLQDAARIYRDISLQICAKKAET